MSTNRKRKSGLQSGLSEIIAKQTAPIQAKQETSANLLEKFRDNQPPESSESEQSSLLKIDLPKSSSLLETELLGYPKTSLLKSSSPPQNEQSKNEKINLMAALPEVDGYTKLWHQMTDFLYRQLTPSEQAVHIQLFRLSWGHNKETCVIGLPGLSKRTGIAKTTIQRAVDGLIEKGLIEKIRAVFGREVKQGIEYRIVPPSALLKSSRLLKSSSLLDLSSSKETHIKETHTNTETLADAREKTPVGVRVASRFSLQECRKYAESLRQDGITNPGGYATKIHRSGEADDLIAMFLNPPDSVPVKDVRACPDCNGTGWRESNNPEQKGVVRCKHEKLMSA